MSILSTLRILSAERSDDFSVARLQLTKKLPQLQTSHSNFDHASCEKADWPCLLVWPLKQSMATNQQAGYFPGVA